MVENENWIPWTVSSIKKNLLDYFSDISSISDSTIRRVLKTNLNFSFKKLAKCHRKIFNKEGLLRMVQSACLLQILKSSEREVIYLDEFSLNPGKSKVYGWGPKNCKNFVSYKTDYKPISLIVALSSRRYYGIMGRTHPINGEIFLRYLKNLIKDFKEDKEKEYTNFSIVADNAAIHKTPSIEKFLENSKCSMATIQPYCPWLNPSESYISSIRTKIRVAQTSDRIISLSQIKKAVSEVAETPSHKFIEFAVKETKMAITGIEEKLKMINSS